MKDISKKGNFLEIINKNRNSYKDSFNKGISNINK